MKSDRARLAIILATVVIDVIGIGLMWPVLPLLVEELNGGNVASASSIYGWIIALYSLMQFAFGPLMGALSDRFGRRPIIVVSLAGLTVDYLLLALAPSLWWVAVARTIGGIMGASLSTAPAYVADVSPPERRAQDFGLLGVAFGVGFVAGPFLGGVLGELGSRVPFYAAAGFSLAALFFAFFFLPESLPPGNRKPFRLSEGNPIGAFSVLAKYPVVIALVTVFVISSLGERMLESIWVLYTGYRFAWGPIDVGASLAFFGVLLAVVQGGLVRVVVPWLGEVRTIAVGLVVGAVSLFLFGIATEGWMMYAILVLYVLGWGNAGPAMQALVTRAMPASEQGLLQGALNSAQTATGVAAPPIAASLFAYFIGPAAPFQFPGVSFALAGVLFLVALALMLRPSFAAAVAAKPATDPT